MTMIIVSWCGQGTEFILLCWSVLFNSALLCIVIVTFSQVIVQAMKYNNIYLIV